MQEDSLDVIVYLNRGGLGDDYGSTTEENFQQFEFSYRALQSRFIRDIIFCFDPGNPRSMIRRNRDPRKAVLCIQSSGFELSAEWFDKELRSALRAKSRAGELGEEEGREEGRALCNATKVFLHEIGKDLSKMNLSAAERDRRFGPRKNGQPEKRLIDLSRNKSLPFADYPRLVRLWWLTLDCLRSGIEKALRRQMLPDDQGTREIRATVLKLRAHLAACLLEIETIDDVKLLADLHESMLEWMDFNLGSRIRDDDIEFLKDRHKELGDLLFDVKPPTLIQQWLSRLPGFRLNTQEEGQEWTNTRSIAVRQAILSIDLSALPDERKAREIIDRYEGSLRRAGELFSRRFDIRELVTVSSAWPQIRKSQARRQPLSERASAFMRGLFRHLPWPYPAFLFLAILGWSTIGTWNISKFLFTAQFSIVYLLPPQQNLWVTSGSGRAPSAW